MVLNIVEALRSAAPVIASIVPAAAAAYFAQPPTKDAQTPLSSDLKGMSGELKVTGEGAKFDIVDILGH